MRAADKVVRLQLRRLLGVRSGSDARADSSTDACADGGADASAHSVAHNVVGLPGELLRALVRLLGRAGVHLRAADRDLPLRLRRVLRVHDTGSDARTDLCGLLRVGGGRRDGRHRRHVHVDLPLAAGGAVAVRAGPAVRVRKPFAAGSEGQEAQLPLVDADGDDAAHGAARVVTIGRALVGCGVQTNSELHTTEFS